jgi:hypothetical protein
MDLERIERESMADHIRAAPDELRARLSLGMWERDGALMTRLERIDLLQFNRVIGLSAPLQRRAVEEMLAWYRAAGLKKHGLQLLPEVAAPWLDDLGLVLGSRWAKLSRATENPLPLDSPFGVAPVEPRHASLFGKLICEAYGMPAALAPWNAALAGARAGAPTWPGTATSR